MSDNRPIAYREEIEGRSVNVFRASSVGRSVRCLSASLQGYSPLPAPSYLLKAAASGNRYEGVVKQRLREEHGFTIDGEQSTLETWLGTSTMIRGHLDGERIYRGRAGEHRILEVKSMSGRVFDKWTRDRFASFPEYAAQISTYMAATKRKAVYAVVNRDDEFLEWFDVDEPPVPWTQIVQRVLMAVRYAERGELPECDSASQYSCPYDYLCDKRPLFTDEVEAGTDAVLVQLGHEYDEIRKLEQDLKGRKADVRDQIITSLGSRERVQAGQWSFTKKVRQRKSLDTRALRQELGDRLDGFFNETESEALTVTERKVKEDG